jgi:hypothetical protein
MRAGQYDQPAVVDLLLDRKWWKDDEALIRFIECASGTGDNTILNSKSGYREIQPRLVERVEKALAAARKKDKKP